MVVEGLSKKFCSTLRQSIAYGILDISKEICGKASSDELRRNEFWAVRKVSFELKRGECLGLIGRNGAGKTTLLKLINGLIKPSAGQIIGFGSISGLIALGAGFSPVLTGRENIYINGSVLGFGKRQVDSKLDEIVHFAELESFIDTPVRNYSPGMQVRLGFAIAVVLIRPDILLLDEVLAVGDIAFTLKCLNAVRDLLTGSAAILVSHQLQLLSRFCTRLAVLEDGQIVEDSQDIAHALSVYLAHIPAGHATFSSEGVKVSEVRLVSSSADGVMAAARIAFDAKAELSFTLDVAPNIEAVGVRVLIEDPSLTPIIVYCCSDAHGKNVVFGSGRTKIHLQLGNIDLAPGKYSFTIVATTPNMEKQFARYAGQEPFQVVGPVHEWAAIKRNAIARVS